MKLTESMIQSIFITECNISKEDYKVLTEEQKEESIKDIASNILKNILAKLENAEIDTTPIDRSRGDIKELKDINSLQTAVNQLQELIDRSQIIVTPDLKNYVKEVIKSIMYLNQYSEQFKEAYRNKKTLSILKYQSIIMSIFSSVSYLISVMLDFSGDNVHIKETPHYEEIAPITTLINFNHSVETGAIKDIFKDVDVIREYFLEVSPESMKLIESSDIITAVIDGVKNLYKELDSGNKITGLLYRVAGAISLILSLREIFYTMFKTKTKLSEMIESIKSFAGISENGSNMLAKLSGYARKLIPDIESSTDLARRDIKYEDNQIIANSNTEPSPASKPETNTTASSFNLGW